MSAFIRRFRDLPTLEQLTAIEQITIIDRTPQVPVTGVGFGTLLLVGEFEDGAFNTPTEVLGANDERSKFGGFGYQYGDSKYQNPCGRRHLAEDWNGNGWIKGLNLRPQRKIICRVDTSVGDVRFTLAAAVRSAAAPFDLTAADQATVTTDTGAGASTAITATVATAAGAGFAPGPTGYTGGEQIGITIDALPEVVVSFQVGDQTAANVVSRINAFLGSTLAVVNAGEIDISSIQAGSGASVVLRDVTDPGGGTTLAAIGHVAGASAGAGNVANVNAVTAAEAANLINSVAVAGVNGIAAVDAATQEVVVYRTGSATGTIKIDDTVGTMATDMGFTTGTVVTANVGAAFDLAAGTRVRNAGGDEWVTMRSISWPEGTVAAPNDGTQDVEVRPATDDGTALTALAGTVTTLADLPSSRMVEVTNPSNLSAALTEAQIDAAYAAAFTATEDPTKVSRATTVMISARRSAQVIVSGRQSALDASAEGCQGRVFVSRAPIGYSSAQAIADVASYRRDRVVYTWPGWTMYVAEIATLGAAGGTGFNASGIISIGGDGPLADLMCALPPEENVGQVTGRPDLYLADIEATGETMGRTLYTALKTAGICAPRVDDDGNFVYQSEVTTSSIEGRKTIKRRRMADYIQDSFAKLAIPFTKKLATDARRSGMDAAGTEFLEGLLSRNAPDAQRIADYSFGEVTNEYDGYEARGVFVWASAVRLLSSMDTIVFDTEIGEGVTITEAE